MDTDERVPRLLMFGAHPDDCDLKAGGTAALYAARGWKARFVSVTNGDAGHHEMSGPALAKRRQAELEAAGTTLGIEYEALPFHDGQLMPTLEARLVIIEQIRRYRPDVIFVHRPNDYHPDHRYTSQLVQDAAYMVTVPSILPEVPHLAVNPTIMYVSDSFQKPEPFQADLIIDIESVIDKKLAACACHESQFYEWLPFNGGYLREVPDDNEARERWLFHRLGERFAQVANDHRDALIARVGEDKARSLRYVEAFELCEYGSPLTDAARQRLFPFAL